MSYPFYQQGAGKQWRWLLTSRLLNVVVSRGKFNDVIAQVRFSSEYLLSEDWCGDALSHVHTFLISIFGEYIHLQLSEVHLCADVVGYDFSQCNYETQFVTRVRKNEAFYGTESVSLDCHRVSTLAFSKHKAPLSCAIYNKTLEITQKSGKSGFITSGARTDGMRLPMSGAWSFALSENCCIRWALNGPMTSSMN